MSRTSQKSFRLAVLALGALALAACADERSSGDVDEAGEASSEDELDGVKPAWFRLHAEEGALFMSPVAGGTMACASGETAARCAVTKLDLKRSGVSAEAIDQAGARVLTLAQEDGVLVFGRPLVRAIGPAEARVKTHRLVASRVYENVARVSLDGELLAVTKLETPAPCQLARELPSPRGALAPPIVETFDGTCAHKATRIGTDTSFDIDEPDWVGAQPVAAAPAPAGMMATSSVATGVGTDLAQGDAVLVVGRWTSAGAPISRPQPKQIWRDMKHTMAH